MTSDIKIIEKDQHMEFHQKGFPCIYLDYKEGHPKELFNSIKISLCRFNYKSLESEWHIKSFQTQKKLGRIRADYEICKTLDVISTEDKKPYFASHANKLAYILDWSGSIGRNIFQEIPLKLRKRHFPVADFKICPHGPWHHDLKIHLSCLKNVPGIGYVSPIEPKITINGKKYIIAFPDHIINRLGADLPWGGKPDRRFISDCRDYLGLGDFHGFLFGCDNFELSSKIFNPKTEKYKQSITCFETCVSPDYFIWNYVTELLNKPCPDQKYYFRVGYFTFNTNGKYAVLTTLLLP